jgi:asparagine synthase (glutamine-hydrolysing)
LLPAEVVQSRAKRGFPIPGSFWRSQRVNETVREILLSKESLSRGLFTPAALRQSCDDVTQCWPLLNVELWFRVFVDRDPSWLARAKDASEAVIRS